MPATRTKQRSARRPSRKPVTPPGQADAAGSQPWSRVRDHRMNGDPPQAPTVFVVDDDESVRKSLRWLVESVGLTVREFGSAAAFLDHYDDTTPGCLVLDVRMRDMSGIELLRQLRSQDVQVPTLIITAHGDVTTAVEAMKLGAVDFVEKPLNYQKLLDRIQAALKIDARKRTQAVDAADARKRLAALTPRERQVLDGVVSGKMNKQIADDLNITAKTVEMHRGHVMKKMRAGSLAELVRMCVTANTGSNEV